jgi:hypothetical protein
VKNLRIQALLLSLALTLMPIGQIAAAPDLGESLDYTLRFRGIVTGFVELDIAKLTLSVAPSMEEISGHSAYNTHMQLTTAPYKKAEMIYPVRLDYRSWLDQQTLRPLLAAKYLVTDETKRELFWYDQEGEQGYHYQTAKKADESTGHEPADQLLHMASLSGAEWSDLEENKRIALDPADIVDYMSMLHQLRHLPLEPGKRFDFTVFTGKKLEYYRVRIERDRLVKRGWDRNALLLTLYEYEPKHDRLKDEIKLWISDDDQRRMLRFYAESTWGALEGMLETGRPDNGHNDDLSESTRRSLETYLDF